MKILSTVLGLKLKLFSILTLIMLLQSCTKNNDDPIPIENTYYYLTEAQLNQTPYFTNKAFDTISYTSNKGDTITFVKTKTDTSWYGKRANANPENQSMNYYQIIHNSYSTIKGEGKLDIKHSKEGYYYGPLSDLIEVRFNELYFLVNDYFIGSPSGGNFYSIILKDNKTYYNAVDVFHNMNDSLTGISYLNKDFGFFSVKNNKTNKEFNYISK